MRMSRVTVSTSHQDQDLKVHVGSCLLVLIQRMKSWNSMEQWFLCYPKKEHSGDMKIPVPRTKTERTCYMIHGQQISMKALPDRK
jgi:hypothetical protein